MIIVLEGPDGAGKTTLARRLQEVYGLAYRHEGVPPAEVDRLRYYGAILDASRGTNVVHDRLALGERVYGPEMRGVDNLGPFGWRLLSRLFSAVGAVQVIVLPPPAVCHRRWSTSEKEELFPGNDGLFWRTYAAYVYLAATDRRFVTLDTTDASATDDFLYRELTRERPSLREGMVGSPAARYLLVGERIGDPTPPNLDLPFLSTTGCSPYLTAALDLAGFCEEELAWVNAYDRRGAANFLPRENALGYPWKVIALGERAHFACEKAGLAHRAVPHPQYRKRFFHARLEEYAELLGSCR